MKLNYLSSTIAIAALYLSGSLYAQKSDTLKEKTIEEVVVIGYGKAKAKDFDLVITDLKMSGIDGKTVLKALKQRSPQIPVVLFSIYHDDRDKISDSDLALADGLISKPFESEELSKIIQDILNRA